MNLLRTVKKRPGLILGLGVCRLLAAWLAALPLVAQLQGSGLGQLADGDRALFAPGALILVEVIARHGSALGSALGVSLVIFCVAGTLLLAPFALLLIGLASPGRLSIAGHATRLLEALPRLALWAVVTLAARALAVVVGVVLFAIVTSLVETGSPSVRGTTWACGLLALAFVWLSLSLFRDLGYCATVSQRARFFSAVALAARILRRRPRAILGAYALFAGASAVLVVANAVAADALDVSAPGAHRVVLAIVVHQVTLLALVVLRASWLEASLVTINSWLQAPADKRGRSDATADPNPDPAASSGPPALDSVPS